jgi:tetratricopeptide (TPR) repeat protein
LNADQTDCPRCGAHDDPNEPLHASDGSDTQDFSAPGANKIPVVEGGIDPVKHHLTSFEAYVLSLVDGLSDIETLGQVAGLQTIEVQSLLHSLADRGVVKLVDPAAPQKAVLGKMATAKVVTFRQPTKPPSAQLPPLQQAIELESRGDLKAAIQILEAALTGSTEPAPLYNRLALVLVKDRKDFTKAESLLRKAIELAPTRELYKRNLAQVLELSAKQRP